MVTVDDWIMLMQLGIVTNMSICFWNSQEKEKEWTSDMFASTWNEFNKVVDHVVFTVTKHWQLFY